MAASMKMAVLWDAHRVVSQKFIDVSEVAMMMEAVSTSKISATF
jgi:hypothetical protein